MAKQLAGTNSLGLFIGRVATEQLKLPAYFALIITLFSCLITITLLRKLPTKQTSPLLWLWLYIVYPDQSPLLVATALTLTLLTLWQTQFAQRWRFSPKWVAAAIFLIAIILYTATLAPGLMPADNGEFQLVASQWGVAHPPGFPLYTILGNLFSRLPLPGNAAYRLNLFSAVSSAGTLVVLYLACWTSTKRHRAGILATTALATSTTFWTQASYANIRSMTALFGIIAFWGVCWLTEQRKQSKRPILLFAISLALGVTHHPSLAFMGGIWGIYVGWLGQDWLKSPRNWGGVLIAGILGMLPLLYLPLRGGMGAIGAPPDLATWDGFWHHFLAHGFAGDLFYFRDGLVLWERIKIMGNIFSLQFNSWLLVGAIVGWLILLWQRWRLGLIVGLSFGLHTLITATYRAPQSMEYLLPAYGILAFCLGYATELDQYHQWRITTPITIILLTASLLQGIKQAPNFFNFQDESAGITEKWLNNAPTNATIFTNWHWATPLWYLQQVEGVRPDVQVQYLPPAASPYAQTWAEAIQQAIAEGKEVIATNYFAKTYGDLPAFEPYDGAFYFRQTPRLQLPADFTPLPDHAPILGYTLSSNQVEIGAEILLTVAWQPDSTTPTPIFAHLVSQQGKLVGQADLTVVPPNAGIALTRFKIVSRPATEPGRYELIAGTSDILRTPITQIQLTPMRHPPITQHPLYRPVPSDDSNLILVGYDWDHTIPSQFPRLYLHWRTNEGYRTERFSSESYPNLSALRCHRAWHLRLPCPIREVKNEYYVPFADGIIWTGERFNGSADQLNAGNQFTLPLTFLSSKPIRQDYVVSVRLVGYEPDDFHWAWDNLQDSVPALGGIPTLKWVGGSKVYDPHLVTVSSNVSANQQIEPLLMLYSAFTQERLPILDERFDTVWLPMGKMPAERIIK